MQASDQYDHQYPPLKSKTGFQPKVTKLLRLANLYKTLKTRRGRPVENSPTSSTSYSTFVFFFLFSCPELLYTSSRSVLVYTLVK